MRTVSPFPIPWHPLQRSEGFRPFFIIGSGRSGTTLLRRLLQNSDELHIPPETEVLGQVIKVYRQNRGRPWRDLVYLVLAQFEYHEHFAAFEISLSPLAKQLVSLDRGQRSLARILDEFYRFHAASLGRKPRYWGDKSPINTLFVERIRLVFPDMLAIHIIRDGADVVSSFVRSGVIADLDAAAERWVDSVRSAQRFGRRHPESSLQIRYEDLVVQPQVALEQVTRFLDIAYSDALLADGQEPLGDVERYAHHSGVQGPIKQSSIGRGREALSAHQRRLVGGRINETLVANGYEPLT